MGRPASQGQYCTTRNFTLAGPVEDPRPQRGCFAKRAVGAGSELLGGALILTSCEGRLQVPGSILDEQCEGKDSDKQEDQIGEAQLVQ
jgi:hypothetical protein